MAAKRKQKKSSSSKPGTKPWIAIALGLAMAAVALAALLGGRPLGSPTATRPAGVSAPQAPSDSSRVYDSERDHDREQIDQASRDRLRAILREEGGGE